VPLLVTVLAGNIVTAVVVAACLNAADATVLRRLHPAIAVAIAPVPWADTTTPVLDITRWRAALPAAVGCKLSNRSPTFVDADIACLPTTLRSLDVSNCRWLTPDASFVNLSALESLNCCNTNVVATGAALLPPSLRELRMSVCKLHTAADFSHLRALRVLECTGMHNMLSAANIGSLPPSLEKLNVGGICFNTLWPRGVSLAHLTRLRVLRLSPIVVDAPILATFPPSLYSLDLRHCKLPAAASFAHLRCLHTLNANNSDISDTVLTTLPPSLVSLYLLHAGTSGLLSSAAAFPHLPALRVLNVCNTGIGNAAIASMPPSLLELRIANCRNVTQHATLDHLPALRELHSSGTDIPAAAIASCRARGCTAPADGIVTNADEVLLVASLPAGQLVSSSPSRVALWGVVQHGSPLASVSLSRSLAARALGVLRDGHRVAIAVSGQNEVSSCIIV